jgi:hypothetical protein
MLEDMMKLSSLDHFPNLFLFLITHNMHDHIRLVVLTLNTSSQVALSSRDERFLRTRMSETQAS